MTIYYVEVGRTRAELEITSDMIRCTSGPTMLFELERKDLLLADHVSGKTVLLNFFLGTGQDECRGRGDLVQVCLSSNHCLSIMRDLLIRT